MRQRVKRRLFMMSMALATGASSPAFAKGGNAYLHDDARAGAHLIPLPDSEGLGWGKRPGLIGSMKALAGNLGSSPDAASGRGWRMELMPHESESKLGLDTRPDQAMRIGVAWRVAF